MQRGLVMFGKRLTPYEVVVHVDGRHPYLESHELDYPTRDLTLVVPAKSWDHAATIALRSATHIKGWRFCVTSIYHPTLKGAGDGNE
jgi:hypothetical protein